MDELYHKTIIDSRYYLALNSRRKQLLRYLDGPFIPEISCQIDAVDALLDEKGGHA